MSYGCEIDAPARTDATAAALERLRSILQKHPGPARVATALSAAFDRWRTREHPERRAAIAKVAAASRWSTRLLDESIDALLAPFTRDALVAFAGSIVPRQRLGGFIMPGNVPGAGMHELVLALLSGATAMVKTSNREPSFFPALVSTLREIDPAVAALVEVTTFGRERDDLTRMLCERCDFVVALGDDASLTQLGSAPHLFGFGSRASGAVVSVIGPTNLPRLASAVARDVVLFEQQGCLSPHHLFVEEGEGTTAREFAIAVAEALSVFAETLPPPTLSLHHAATIRRIREQARWRGLGGQSVELFEGDAMSWTVILEPAARFTISPGYRMVTISTIRDTAELAVRLAPLAGRIEAFAIATPSAARARFLDVLAGAGATYVCDPGKMQSPPINWPHGGGAFLDFITAR